jgi:hypothetical protein
MSYPLAHSAFTSPRMRRALSARPVARPLLEQAIAGTYQAGSQGCQGRPESRPRWCGAVATPPRPCGQAAGSVGGVTVAGARALGSPTLSGEDIARLNGVLADHLRFAIQAGSAAATDRDPREARGMRPGREDVASGVLTMTLPDGATRTVTRPLVATGRRRYLLLSLSTCLAECAMALGLGAGVYRRSARGISRMGRPTRVFSNESS